MRGRGFGIWLLALLPACVIGSGPEARTTAAPEREVERALARHVEDGACRDRLREEFTSGEREADGRCGASRDRVARELRDRRARFGIVEQRDVDLRGVQLRLAIGRGCRAWPLRRPEDAVLGAASADRAGCQRETFDGWVAVDVVDRDGQVHPRAFELEVLDGRAAVDFASLDGELERLGLGGLDRVATLDLGWAGAVNVQALLDYRARWHFEWVARGWGSPALFVARHEGHERDGEARALAVEASLDRQRRDYQAVAAGELAPELFLLRHVWSPYRASVQHMAAARLTGRGEPGETPPVQTSAPTGPEAATPDTKKATGPEPPSPSSAPETE